METIATYFRLHSHPVLHWLFITKTTLFYISAKLYIWCKQLASAQAISHGKIINHVIKRLVAVTIKEKYIWSKVRRPQGVLTEILWHTTRWYRPHHNYYAQNYIGGTISLFECPNTTLSRDLSGKSYCPISLNRILLTTYRDCSEPSAPCLGWVPFMHETWRRIFSRRDHDQIRRPSA